MTAAGLADEDVTWTRLDETTFTGKAPASALFTQTGEYSLSLTDWEQMTEFNFTQDAISGDISGWILPSSLTRLYLYQTSLSGDISGWILPSSMTRLYLTNTALSGDIGGWALPSLLTQLHLQYTSFSGDIGGWTLPSSLVQLRLYETSFSGDISGWTLPSSLIDLYVHVTSVSGDISGWTLPSSLANLYLGNTSVDYGTGNALADLTASISVIRFDSCNWSTTEVDRALADCVDSGPTVTGKTLNVSGTNAAPTSKTDPSSYWTLVEDRGWTVTTS